MRIAILNDKDIVQNIVLAEPGFFQNGVVDRGYRIGDKINRVSGSVAVPAVEEAPVSHLKEFYADDLLAAFTADEFNAIDASNNPSVKRLIRRLTVRKKVKIEVNSQVYLQSINLLFAQNLISQARHDELLKGVPI